MRKMLLILLAVTGFVSTAMAEEIKLPFQGMTLNANLEKAGDSWPAGPVVLMTHGTLAAISISAATPVASSSV